MSKNLKKNIKDKYKFIYNNIGNIQIYDDIIFFIKNNNISYSENNNSMIVNISLIKEPLITNLYDIILNLINESIEKIKPVKYEIKKKYVEKKTDYSFDFTKQQKNILQLSKKI